MTIIHIFNPEADYALGDFKKSYTPPASVITLRRQLALTPLRYAAPGDFILLLDDPAYLPPLNIVGNESVPTKIIGMTELKMLFAYLRDYPHEVADYQIRPWGWTPSLKHLLKRAGAPEHLLPTDAALLRLRQLASRETSIAFNRYLNRELGKTENLRHITPVPELFRYADKALEWKEREKKVVFKYAWSSSGRGILMADEESDSEKLRNWINGGISRHGFVTGERFFRKCLDFATEWKIDSGRPKFLGLSVFRASESGKYEGNISENQANLKSLINSFAPDFDEDFIEMQGNALSQVAEGYTGYAGIDMMADSDGIIRGGVEINFRMTMGIVALLEQQLKLAN